MRLSKEERIKLNNQIKSLERKISSKRDETKSVELELNACQEKLLNDRFGSMIGKPFAITKNCWNKLFLFRKFKGKYLVGITIQYSLADFSIFKVDFEENYLSIEDIGRTDETELW